MFLSNHLLEHHRHGPWTSRSKSDPFHTNGSPKGSRQSASGALRAIETAMTRVASDLLSSRDSGTPSVLISLDISAAFDTLDYNQLLERARGHYSAFPTPYWIGLDHICRTVSIKSRLVVNHQTYERRASEVGTRFFPLFHVYQTSWWSDQKLQNLVPSIGWCYSALHHNRQMF